MQKTPAQQRFIKTIADPDFGSNLRVLPTLDNGWLICTLDNLKMTKFNNCGKPQWSRHLLIPNASPSLYDLIKTSDGGVALLTRIAVNSSFAALITKTDASGTILWSKSFEDPTNDYSQFPYTISEDSQGNLSVFCGALFHISNNNTYNLIIKMTANGNLIYSNFYSWGGIWGGSIATSDNGVLIRTGNALIKTGITGNIQWSTIHSGNTYSYLAPLEVNDGYIFTGYTNTGNLISFYKVDFSGALVQDGFKVSNISGNPPLLVKKSNGNFAAAFLNSIVEFDKDLNIIQQGAIDNNLMLYGKAMCYLNNGYPLFAGIQSPSNNVFFAKMGLSFLASCQGSIPALILNTASSNQIPVSISYFPYNLIVVNHTFISDTVTVLTNDICNQPFILNIGNDTLLCEQSTLLIYNNSDDGFDNYLWSTGETTESITVNNSGIYHLMVTYNCNNDTLYDSIKVAIAPPVNSNLGDDIIDCENKAHLFTAPYCFSCDYLWNTGSIGDTIMALNQGSYWLQVKDTNGCIYTDTVLLDFAKCECNLFLPNSFTPNDDGINETFFPTYYCDLADYELSIFNRRGQKIFSTDNSLENWNGIFNKKKVASDVYLYTVQYTPIIQGKTGKMLRKTGTILVLY